MTSRPGPGIQESLQHRGGGPAYRPVRRVPRPQHGPPRSSRESERRAAEERVTRPKGKRRPVQLEGIQTATDGGVRPPPKGKPQLFFSNVAGNAGELSPHGPPAQNLPVPPRPGSSLRGGVSHQRRSLPGGTGVKIGGAPKARGPEAPAPAAVLPGGKTADLFPWTGRHPEDALSEALVKAGTSNKSQIMNETNTARPSLWSNLRNKSGISALSTLFVAVLEKRQSCGRLTTPNTFKPPPRLTLRDSTRESWLHDLANPAVGLRRLSRTIPHGITGKVLLDQCLNKNIPIPRATWLAKCVGINEMRAHKRKGQAGTITWVRGWTNSVEQFLDGVIANIGQQEWKSRITYALQLTTHLFKEHLLEDDHFLDWVLKSIESCPSERLFIWLLIVSIPSYWLELTSSRRRGKILAESLLNHAEKLYDHDDEGHVSPVLEFIEDTVVKLVVTRPACFLLPRTWKRHGAILRALAQRRSSIDTIHTIAELDARNMRILPSSGSRPSQAQNSIGRIYRLLDHVDYSVRVPIDELAFDCMEIMPDANSLMTAALQWACSLYRQGSHRIYLVTRLLRKWSRLGADVYDGILAFLHTMASGRSEEPRVVFRVVAELIRSKTFPAGRYLQWLIATGSLSHHPDLCARSAWPLRLMTEMPLSGLSDNVQNLRYTLLRGTTYSAEAEEQALDLAEDAVRRRLPSLFNTADAIDSTAPVDLGALSPTVRLELGTWLRQQIAAHTDYVERVPTKDPAVEVTGTVCRISLQDFQVVRSYLELFDDLSILADVIGIVATSLDSNVLGAAADTLHHNHKAFRAIGAFEPLFEKIAMRYAAIRTVRFPERDLLLSLSDLARTARADTQLTQLLSYDLSRYDQKNSIAACSPASDNMNEALAPLDVEDEIERILSSGTSMDQQMMSRVFRKIAHSLEEQLCKGGNHFESFPSWFYRLRNFEESTFDMILASWLGSLLMSHQQLLLRAALPPLVSSGCLTLSRFIQTIQLCIRNRRSTQPAEALQIAIEGLDNLILSEDPNRPCQPRDAYRYSLEQRKICQERGRGILDLIVDIVNLGSAESRPKSPTELSDVLSNDRLLMVLRDFAIYESQSLSESLCAGEQPSSSAKHTVIKTLLDRLLDPASDLGLAKKSLGQQVTVIVESANDLTLPFCQLQLQQIFFMSKDSLDDNAVEGVSAALLLAVKDAVEKDRPSWTDLLTGLDTSLTSKIREHAERELINASAFLCGVTVDEAAQVADEALFVRKSLTVIDFTTTDTLGDEQTPLLVSLIERLKGLAEAFGKRDHQFDGSAELKKSPSISSLCLWLNALLQLTVTHGSLFLQKASNEHQAALLWHLRALGTQLALEAYPSIVQYIFDVAVLLSDSVSENVRKHLARLDVTKAVDNRWTFIYGAVASPDGWLTLTKPANTPSNPHPTASPQAQPQPSSQYQLQYAQQPQGLGSVPLQRAFGQQQYQQQMPSPGQTNARAYPHPQHPQPNKMFPQQLQRMAPNGHNGPPQLQQMQQMQALTQQRNTRPSPVQQQRAVAVPPPPPPPTSGVRKGGAMKQDNAERKAVAFALRRWEILPDSGGNAGGNETAISLGLFGARKV